ncbi:MAG: hypothetical protein EBR84_02660, partial [Actinobacteria bacterium]|nr:hypothetical protein [Actinomycetota bacterium]
SRTIVYKGMLTTGQLEPFFPDLSDPRFTSAIGLVHSRFSTNTFPSWPLAHPYRFIAHNGEINTVRGNRNWIATRESQFATDLIDGDLSRLFPICSPTGSDSASLDEVLEMIHLSGRSLPHAVLMLVPEAWENNTNMDPDVRAFYQFHASLTEPCLPDREHIVHPHGSVIRRQQTFGYTEEELRILVAPMARSGGEALGSMGTDTPIAVLSERPRLLFDYFIQLFAQVTNPPLDAIREELVTSLRSSIGPEVNLLAASPEHCKQLTVPFPVIDNDELAKIVHINAEGDRPGLAAVKIQGLYQVAGGAAALEARLNEICAEVSQHVAEGKRFLVLSDRDSSADLAPIPSLLLTAAVHHHLIRQKERTKVGLVVEAGDVREVHHVALLIGYGAAAVNPYLAMESVEDLVNSGFITGISSEKAVRNLVKALGKGVLKVMSKMGISTVPSYTGAQVFEAIGLAQELVDKYFTGTTSRLGGVGLEVIAREIQERHETAYPPSGIPPAHRTLRIGGEYQWRREGEPHLFNPETVFR